MNTESLIAKWWSLEREAQELLTCAELSTDFDQTYQALAQIARWHQKTLGKRIADLARRNPVML